MITVFTNGCFDVLHAGHVQYLERARELGDCLIIGVNSDWSVSQLKGADRPINRLADRMAVLRALRCVSAVIPFADLTPEQLVRGIQPQILVKGPGYSLENCPEARAALEWGGKLFVLDGPDISTTEILRRMRGDA